MPEIVKNACYRYAEDDPFSRKLMEMIAEKVLESSKMTIFENSQDFMQRLRALPCRPDIILLDIHMKPYNGFEVLKMIRRDVFYQKTKVIALTAPA
jgi:CheY-like chemotaxis protein